MRRRDLEVALRAAARICRDREFFLIGSQAVHAYSRHPPAEVLVSEECDLYPRNEPRTAGLLHSELGRVSKFARARGFYVDVVTPEIATLPNGWKKRLKPLRLGKITAHCLEIHDLLITKLAAGRLKDLEFAASILKRKLASVEMLRRRIKQFPIANERALIRERVAIVIKNTVAMRQANRRKSRKQTLR